MESEFKLGFYKHFKKHQDGSAKLYLAHGIGTYVSIDDVVGKQEFAIGKYHEFREGIDDVRIFRDEDGSFLISGNQKPGLKVVVYQALYHDGFFCVREVDNFMGTKKLGEEIVKKFTHLGTDYKDVVTS